MNLIENQNVAPFEAYLKETKNTICGREPIKLLLAIMEEAQKKGNSQYETKFVKYG